MVKRRKSIDVAHSNVPSYENFLDNFSITNSPVASAKHRKLSLPNTKLMPPEIFRRPTSPSLLATVPWSFSSWILIILCKNSDIRASETFEKKRTLRFTELNYSASAPMSFYLHLYLFSSVTKWCLIFFILLKRILFKVRLKSYFSFEYFDLANQAFVQPGN